MNYEAFVEIQSTISQSVSTQRRLSRNSATCGEHAHCAHLSQHTNETLAVGLPWHRVYIHTRVHYTKCIVLSELLV